MGPRRAETRTSLHDGSVLKLVFSDEFNNYNRTLYPDDDPSWEAIDLYHCQMGNLKWCDLAIITMKDGS